VRNNVFHACLQFSNIASVLGNTRRRIVQDLFDCRRCKRTKSSPPKRFVICCAIQDQAVVIQALLNFLGRAKNLFIGCIFFDRYVIVSSLMTMLPMDLTLARMFMVPSRERHCAARNKTAPLFKLNS
jgi:hypothetical protein